MYWGGHIGFFDFSTKSRYNVALKKLSAIEKSVNGICKSNLADYFPSLAQNALENAVWRDKKDES